MHKSCCRLSGPTAGRSGRVVAPERRVDGVVGLDDDEIVVERVVGVACVSSDRTVFTDSFIVDVDVDVRLGVFSSEDRERFEGTFDSDWEHHVFA